VNTKKKDELLYWSTTTLNRVDQLPQPYQSNFKDWLKQQVGIGHFDSDILANTLENRNPGLRAELISSIEAMLQVTEESFGQVFMSDRVR
jgi:hypothetical protein